MKTRFYNRIVIIGIVLFITQGQMSFAQTISYPAPSQTITRGLDSSKLTVRIDFPACANIKVAVQLGATNSPGSIEYIPGSITKIGGTASLAIAEDDITNLQNPVFSVNNSNTGEYIIFTILRRANCGTASSSKDIVKVSGASCAFFESDPNVNTYNLLAPALTMTTSAAIINAIIGFTYNRTINIVNGGNGCIDSLAFWINYSAGSLKLNYITVGGMSVWPVFASDDSAYFIISGTKLSADSLLCNGEGISINENITVLKCGATTNYSTAWLDFYNTNCKVEKEVSTITMVNATPVLTTTAPSPNYNYCFTGDLQKKELRVTNTGSGPASAITMALRTYVPASFTSILYFDTSLVWTVKNSSGTVIGAVGNFNNIINSNFFDAACVNAGRIQELSGSIDSNIILLAGDYLTVEVFTRGSNLSCAGVSCTDAYGWIGLQSEIKYKNQCGSANYTENFKTQMSRAYTYFRSTIDMPSDISPDVPFNIDVFFSLFRTMNHPNGTGSTFIAIPLLGTGFSPNATSVTYGTYTFPVFVNTDTLFIGPIPQNIGSYEGRSLTIPMIATCGTGGSKNVQFFILNQYSSCAPRVKMGCRNLTTNLHCPSACAAGGATPTKFSLKRINYGLPDNDNDNKPDGSGVVNTTLIKDHNSVNGDTLRGEWNIKVFPNVDITDLNVGVPFNYVYIDFDLGAAGAGQPNTLNALNNAVVKIYPNSNPLLPPIICNVSPVVVGNKAHYELSAACRTGAWLPNDSLVVQALFTVNGYNADRYNGYNTSGVDLFVTKNEVYSSYLRNTTPQLAPIATQTYTCDHYNDFTQINRIWISPYIPGAQVIDGCSNNLYAYIRQYVRTQEGPNIFPYEYRNFFVPDSMTVTIPSGFVYRPNSAIIYATNGSATIPNVNVSQVGNQLYFTSLKNLYSIVGSGTLLPADETESAYIYFSINPDCGATEGVYLNNTHTSGIGNGVNTPTQYGKTLLYNNSYQNASGWVFTAPQPSLTGSTDYNASDGTATWTLALQNQSNITGAPNSYFYFQPVNSFTNLIVKDGATIIAPDANGFYPLGSLAPGSNRIITVQAKTTKCTLDSLKINYGFGCAGLPAAFSLMPCTISLWVKADNRLSEIQLAVTKQISGAMALCSSETIEVVMNSSQAAFADNPVFKIIPPTGLSISSGEIEYPIGSGNWEIITPTISGGVNYYNIESHSQNAALYGSKGLPGTVDYPGIDRRGAKLRLTVSASCSFVSGSKLSIQQTADRPCGTPIDAALGYNNIVRTNPIDIDGAIVSGGMSSSIVSTPSNITCGLLTVNGSCTPLVVATSASDTLVIQLPAGFNYNGNFNGGTQAFLLPGYPAPGPGGSSILRIKIMPGILPGNPINYSFDVAIPTTTSCGNIDIASEVVRSYAPIMCGATLCAAPSKIVVGSSVSTVSIVRPSINIGNVSLKSGNFSAGNTVVINVAVSNYSLTQTIAANSLQVEFFCGTSAIPFASLPFPTSINPSNSNDADMTLAIPNAPICNNGETLKTVIRPANNNCVCNEANFVMGSVALPVEFVSFTADQKNTSVSLQFTVASPEPTQRYVVEESTDGVHFADRQYITGTYSRNYSTSLPLQSFDRIYWRIKGIDNSGKINYSEVRTYSQADEDLVTVFPIPASTQLKVKIPESLKDKALTLILYNQNGIVVLNRQLIKAKSIELLDLQFVPSGIYYLKISNLDRAQFQKVIVEK